MPYNRCCSQQKAPAGLIGLSEYVMLMVKVVELLRELERIFGCVCRLGGRNTLLDNVGELAGR